MVGRTLFVGDVLYSLGVSGFIYPIFGHWCWGPMASTMGSENSFLSSLGMNFHDFAGSTVVHSIGGWVAIAGAIMLGRLAASSSVMAAARAATIRLPSSAA
jgi:Amt family ammonium transporter